MMKDDDDDDDDILRTTDVTLLHRTVMYSTLATYSEDRSKFHMRARYRLAYSFLSRFVRTIEVMMDGASTLFWIVEFMGFMVGFMVV